MPKVELSPAHWDVIHNVPEGSSLIPHPSSLLILPVRADGIAEFRRRWAPELAEISINDILSEHFFMSLAMASSGGHTQFMDRDRGRTRRLWSQIDPKYLREGIANDVFADYGLFAIPLPVARQLYNDPAMKPAELLNAKTSFRTIATLAAVSLTNFRRERKRDPDPLELAITLHGAGKTSAFDNPFGIGYRGSFIPDFIAVYNGYIHLQQPKEPTHGKEHHAAAN